MASTYYACINDQPMPQLARNETVVICGDPDSPAHMAVYHEQTDAMEVRDKLREQADNPAINVYRVALEPVAGEA